MTRPERSGHTRDCPSEQLDHLFAATLEIAHVPQNDEALLSEGVILYYRLQEVQEGSLPFIINCKDGAQNQRAM